MLANNEQSTVLPGEMIGIIGGGQLGRMMALSAREMGYNIAVLDPTPNCPTAQVADEHIVAAYDDENAIKQLIEISDVVTYEFENVNVEAARLIEEAGKLPQGTYALEVTQNREKEKTLINDLGLPVPQFYIVKDEESCREALANIPLPAVIKTCSGGYDGKGQLKIETEADKFAAKTFAQENGTCIVERWVPFDKEISVVFTRTATGGLTIFPVGENKHENHILHETIVPAEITDSVSNAAITAAMLIASSMNIVGTFAIEMFVRGDELYINEMAPRPHNSGHYTIEACNISQFTQHIRAICGLPLMGVTLKNPSIMINLLGQDLDKTYTYMKEEQDGFIHLYGKADAKENRKMGHVTFIAESLERAKEQAAYFLNH